MAISLCQCGTLLTSGGWSRLVLASRLSRATPYSAIGYQTRAERGARGPGQSSIRPGFLPHMAPSPSLPVTPLPRSRTAAVRRWRRGRAVITSQQTGCHPSSGRRSAAVACAERATRHSVVGAAECVRACAFMQCHCRCRVAKRDLSSASRVYTPLRAVVHSCLAQHWRVPRKDLDSLLRQRFLERFCRLSGERPSGHCLHFLDLLLHGLVLVLQALQVGARANADFRHADPTAGGRREAVTPSRASLLGAWRAGGLELSWPPPGFGLRTRLLRRPARPLLRVTASAAT